MPAIIINGTTLNFRVEGGSIFVDGRELSFEVIRREPGRLLVKIGESVKEIIFTENGSGVQMFAGSNVAEVEIMSDRDLLIGKLDSQKGASASHASIRAPMPGLVVKMLVGAGDKLKKGAKLVILEAMKMENEIRTPVDAEVEEILVKEGDIVEKDQVIIKLR